VATDPFQAGPAVGGASTVTPSGDEASTVTPSGDNEGSGIPAPADGPLVSAGDAPGGNGSSPQAPVGRAEARRRRRKRAIIEWVIVLVVALGVAIGMRTFVVQTFYIPSGSMEPTLNIGDRILVDKLSYHLHAVHRGDIIVFARPPGETLEPGVNDLVKRVIGLPGETISAERGQIYINGTPLAEPWLPKGVETGNFSPVHIPKGYYFVMGDNRPFSSDSRVFGPISGSLIVGRVVMRIWPLSHITIF
jgi:signal peptidase I